MPFLRLETATPSETEKQIEELRQENATLKGEVGKLLQMAPSMEALLRRIEELEKRLNDGGKRQN